MLGVAVRAGGNNPGGEVARLSIAPVGAAFAATEAIEEGDAGYVVGVALRRGIAEGDSFGLLGPALAAVLDEGFLGVLDGEAVVRELEIAVIHEKSSLSLTARED